MSIANVSFLKKLKEIKVIKRIYESKKQVEQGRVKKLNSVEDL